MTDLEDLFRPAPTVEGDYHLYVDGSPGPKKGKGWSGWGMALYIGQSPVHEACGVIVGRGTSNALELEAMLHGLGLLINMRLPTMVMVWTDSRYVADMIPKLPAMDACAYMSNGELVKNHDRLRQLYELYYEMGGKDLCLIRWLKGHDKTEGNERADGLARLAAYEGQQYSKDL